MRIERIGDATLYLGDALECLRAMTDESVNCIVTSPPYWGLRDYGTGTWEGGDAECDHDQRRRERDPDSKSATNSGSSRDNVAGQVDCRKCGARRIDQQLGLEPTPEIYMARMVEVFREARRVLRRDGTCWVNLGDSYAGGAGGRGDSGNEIDGRPTSVKHDGKRIPRDAGSLKPKDLCGIPWRVAFALQADGWYLRSDIIWAKPNPMPESVTDRPTKAHEYLFLLSREPRYFYDAEAIREADTGQQHARNVLHGAPSLEPSGGLKNPHGGLWGTPEKNGSGRNRRTVWTIATQPFPEAHFATFPEKLVEPCVLAGCPAQTCPECGAPWERVVESHIEGTARHERGRYAQHSGGDGTNSFLSKTAVHGTKISETLGYRPTCACGREDTMPGTLLDLFCGSGTALLVTLRLGRRAVGIELKPEYMDMARKRIAGEAAQGKLRDIHAQPRLPLEEPEKVEQGELGE